MTMPREMAHAVAQLEDIQSRLQEIARRTDDGRKFDMVNLRRELAAHLGVLGKLAAGLGGEPEIQREYANRFSAMRSAIAIHQSVWPVVGIDQADLEYQQSVTNVRDQSAAFIAWVKALGAQTGVGRA